MKNLNEFEEITESKKIRIISTKTIDDITKILKSYVIDKLGADEPYIPEDSIEELATKIAKLK